MTILMQINTDTFWEKINQGGPKGKIKIANAMRTLLKTKDFNSITTAEISKVAGVNEALIYRYFGDKRGLLHEILSKYLAFFLKKMISDIKGIQRGPEKLRKLIQTHMYLYNYDRVFSKIILLEVRQSPTYFESKTYQLVRKYSKVLLKIIEDGVAAGEITDDISPRKIRQVIFGGIEHFCLPPVIFSHEMDVDEAQDDLCRILFHGILK